MKSNLNEYHLLIAQNFLSNISLDQTPSETDLKLFSRRKQEVASSKNDGQSEISIDVDEDVPLVGPGIGSVSAHTSSDSPNVLRWTGKSKPPKKVSILGKFVRLISTDDVRTEERSNPDEKMIELKVLAKDEARRKSDSLDRSSEDRPISPMSVTQFSFLRRLRTSLSKLDRSRSYLCAPSGAPLIVISHFPFQSTARDRSRLRRSRSSIASNERQQSAVDGSVEELRPFEFRDVECIHFEQLSSKLRRSSAMSFSGVAWKSPSKEERRTSEAPANVTRVGSQYLRENSDQYSIIKRDIAVDDSDSYRLEGGDAFHNDYDPLVLEEVASANRTIIRTNGFIGVTKLFATPQVSKIKLNETFAEKFPHIHLTYSKLRSIKKDLWLLSKECDVDEFTLAQAYVYFERIVCKGLISKYNRKFVAGVAFLVAVKLNDYRKSDIVKVLECAEEKLRVSRRELLSFELPLCSALDFDLFPPVHHIEPHLRKIMFGAF